MGHSNAFLPRFARTDSAKLLTCIMSPSRIFVDGDVQIVYQPTNGPRTGHFADFREIRRFLAPLVDGTYPTLKRKIFLDKKQ